MTVDDHNIITQTSSGGIAQHDHKGNITRLNGAFYYYDDENQLTAVMLTPTKLYSFAYDGKRRKRKQIEFNLVGSTWTPITETWYIYDGMTVIQERSNTNVPTVHYTRGLDLSGTPGGAGGIGGLLTRSSGYNVSTGAWSTHDYYHADGSGNITMLISNSSTPTIRAQYEYDPFGRIQTQSGTLAATNTQRFSSKEQIGSSPLSYYGYRFYHADAQRWMNRDPIEERGGVNLYRFVYNNSLMNYDSLGLSGVFIENIPNTPLTQAPSGNQLIPSKIQPITTISGNLAKMATDPLELGSKLYDVLNAYLSTAALSMGNKAIRLNEIKQECSGSVDLTGLSFTGTVDGVKAWSIYDNHWDILKSGLTPGLPGIPDRMVGNVKMIYTINCCEKTVSYSLVPYATINGDNLYFMEQAISSKIYIDRPDVISLCCPK